MRASHSERSIFSRSGRSAFKMSFTSPTSGTFVAITFPISAGSMSMWITVAWGAKSVDVHYDPVIEPRAEADQEVTFRNCQICVTGPVQAEHAKEERMVAGKTGKAHKSIGYRGRYRFGELQEFLLMRSRRGFLLRHR